MRRNLFLLFILAALIAGAIAMTGTAADEEWKNSVFV